MKVLKKAGVPKALCLAFLCILAFLFPYGQRTESAEPSSSISLSEYPQTLPYSEINGGIPNFDSADMLANLSGEKERYSDLDDLGRCGPANACLGPETLPAENEERGSLSHMKPTGWQSVKYDSVEGKYLYNRCHLIAWSLSAENGNERNLVTGTRYMNTEGMLPFEMQVLDYIRETGNHVLYRSTPVFHEDELICRGVLLEARSVETDDISFTVFCPNVQPGIEIDYQTGNSGEVSND